MPESKADRRLTDAATLVRHQRLRLRQALVVLLLGLGISAGMVLGGVLGVLEPRNVAVWIAGTLGGELVFYGLIRSGWNLRLSADAALTLPQSVFGVLTVVAAYVLFPPIRGLALMALAVATAFGIFALKARTVARLTVFTLVVFAVTMTSAALLAPQRFPPRIELLHFSYLVVLLPLLSLLSVQQSALRRKLRDQRDQIEQAMVRNRLLATQDELTALPNRRHIVELLNAELRRGGEPPCLALLDIDYFKQINDTHGHACGDTVLQAFAACVRGALRDTDVVARWGGEEFLVMLPRTTPAAAEAVIERVRAQVAAAPVMLGDVRLPVCFSAGIARHHVGDSGSATIGRADAALYKAKSWGRNRSVLDGVSAANAAHHTAPAAMGA